MDPAPFESAGYMPVTRSLSAGQRQIVEQYCAYLAGATAPGSPLMSRDAQVGLALQR